MIGDTAPMQIRSLSFLLLSSIVVTAMLLWSQRFADAEPTSRGAEIKRVSYMYNVAEYCGLNTREVYEGYRREMRRLTRQGLLPESTVRWLRIDGIIAADLEYDNRGLVGIRNWCRTEGIDAAAHFVAFRDAELAVQREQGTSPRSDAE